VATAIAVGGLLLSVAWGPAADAKTKARTVKGTYATPAVGVAGNGGGGCSQNAGQGCVQLTTRKSDHYVSISITDASGRPVFASVSQDKATGNGPHMTVPVGDICGKTTQPLSIQGGYPVDVFLWEGPGANPPCAGVATQGTVTAKFTS
jgi:hypothetical protein